MANKNGRNNVYIGQSVDIKARWIAHRSNLKCGTHSNRHLQNYFNKYGIEALTFSVIENCLPDQDKLNEREIYWTEFYDSFKNGFNLNKGENFTCHISIPYKIKNWKTGKIYEGDNISRFCREKRVKYGTIYHITSRKKDVSGEWCLPEINPHTYSLVSPEGELHTFINIAEFARENGSWWNSVYFVLNGKWSQTLGWRLPETNIKKYTLISPSGEKHRFTSQKIFAVEHGLKQQGLNKVLKGTRNQYKGWRAP